MKYIYHSTDGSLRTISYTLMVGEEELSVSETKIPPLNKYLEEYLPQWVVTGTYQGLLPKRNNIEQRIRDQYGEDMVDRVSYLCGRAMQVAGLGNTMRFSAKTYLKILGRDYTHVLDFLESIGLLDIVMTKTRYTSKRNIQFHREVVIKGYKKSFHHHSISTPQLINTIIQVQQTQIDEQYKEAATKALESMKGTIVGEEDVLLEQIVYQSTWLPKIDEYGNRLHTYATNIRKEYRFNLRYYKYPKTVPVEFDFKSSHPFFLYQILQNPNLVKSYIPEIAIGDTVERNLIEVLKEWKKSNFLIDKYYRTLANGTFYKKFFKPMLDECCKGWEPIIRDRAKKSDPKRFKNLSKKNLPKVAFMFVTNGGADDLLDKIGENERYRPYYSLIHAFRNVAGVKRLTAILKVKKPIKKRCMPSLVLQRIESRFVRGVFVKSGIEWGFTIHDSILSLPQYEKQIRDAIGQMAEEMGVASPIVKIKRR
jgi:hypothetical protein